MLSLLLWAPVLMAQAASATWASRARNGDSLTYHAQAAVFSHGVWFTSNTILVSNLIALAREGSNLWVLGGLGLFYTIFCVSGSVLAHYLERRFGKRGKHNATDSTL